MELAALFYHTDEFCKSFEKQFKVPVLSNGSGIRKRACKLAQSEVMTISIHYHQSGYKTFKDYYKRSGELKSAFPNLTSYNRLFI